MSKTLKLSSVGVQSEYVRAQSEEGPYDAHVGYAALATVVVEGGQDYYSHPFVSRDSDEIASLCDELTEAGKITVSEWEFISHKHTPTEYERMYQEWDDCRRGM